MSDPLEQLLDAVAAAAFRRLVRHCLADWIRDGGYPGDKDAAREVIHGMPMSEWKARHQSEATPEQIARMEASVARNQGT